MVYEVFIYYESLCVGHDAVCVNLLCVFVCKRISVQCTMCTLYSVHCTPCTVYTVYIVDPMTTSKAYVFDHVGEYIVH